MPTSQKEAPAPSKESSSLNQPTLDKSRIFEYSQLDDSHIALIFKLWIDLKASGDLGKVFYPENTTAYGLLTLFARPARTFFCLDEKGIWMIMWFTPWFSGSFVGLWIRDDMRRTKTAYENLMTLHRGAFELVPVLLSVTKLPEILEMHVKLGYDISTAIPHLFEGRPGWLTHLTKEKFLKLRGEK